MKLIFKGKVAVVTGGSGGIGLDVSKKLAKLKIKVLILDINKPNIIKNKFIYFEQVDLSNENQINQAISKFIKKEKRKSDGKKYGNIRHCVCHSHFSIDVSCS